MAKKTKDSNLSLEERLEQALIPNWDEPYKLPQNWCWTKIGMVTSLYRGVSYKKHEGHAEKGINDCLVMRGGNIQEGEIDTDVDNIYVDKKLVSEEQYVKKHDVIIVSSTGSTKVIGRAGISFADYDDVAFGAFLTLVRPNESVHKPYVSYYFQGDMYRNRMRQLASGVNINNIRNEYITDTPIPLPPLNEQKRIVTHIESLFAKLDEAKEKAQEVVDGFETRKAAILHKAFSGELTAKWREENGVALTSWLRCAYSELGTSKLGKMLDKVKNSGRQVPYLRNVNVRWFGFDLSDVSQMLASEEEIKLLSVKRGDVFICEGGEPGRCAIWRDSDSNMIFQKALHRFRPNDKIIGDFLCYNLYFLSVNGVLEKYFTGSTIKHLTGQSLAKIIVSVPTINEQKEIVDILDQMLSKEQQAKETAEAVIERIDTMKKAILARSFRGELGTSDPNEESAVELLKRVLSGGEN